MFGSAFIGGCSHLEERPDMLHRILCASGAALALAFAATPAGAVINLTSDGGYVFDIQDTYAGNLSDGSSDAYDGCYTLRLNGVDYSSGGVAGVQDGRNVTMATVTMATSLSVTRHAFVPETGGDYIRFFDVIENTGASAATVDVTYFCNFGSDSGTTIWGSYSGDGTVTTDDYWFGTDDSDSSGDPSLAHAYFGDGAMITPSAMTLGSGNGDSTVTFPATIGAGETVAFLVFGFQGPNEASVRTQVEALVDDVSAATDDLDGGDLSLVVNWGLGGAPLIRWPADQLFEVPEGSDLPLAVTVEDREGDATTTAWDLDNDGDFDDADGESAVLSAAGLDGPLVLTIGVRSTDAVGNVSDRHRDVNVLNAPPVLSSPTEATVLIGQEFTYTPVVSDPGNDEVTVVVQDRPVGMVLLADGAVRWTPTSDDVGVHVLSFVATDDDDDPDVVGDGDAVLQVTITVVENQPPAAPAIVSPARSEDVPVARPTLTVTTPSDPEGDALFIWFEVDTVDTYPDPIASGPVPATAGSTSWILTEDLVDGQRYHWRVWATDDNGAESSRASSYFNIALDGDAGADAGADGGGGEDGGGDEDGGVHVAHVEGCGCAAPVAPARSAGAAALILAVLAALIWLRRP
jgi:hypothetical protein